MELGSGLDDLTALHDERSRSITAENPDGDVGAGGQEASNLGPSRKGRPCITLEEDETTTLMDVDGPGVIRHIWLTVPSSTDEGDFVLRDLVLRMYWDGEDDPSVEVPLGDFFASGHGQRANVNSEPVVVAPNGGFNSYWPMPFREHAEVTIENQHGGGVEGFFYQFDYSVKDELGEETAYFHAQWRRSNPVDRGEDHIILDNVEGHGHYVGTYLAWAALGEYWWGEGEVKFYVDGDDEFPTICGTGTEDYVGGAWCFGDDETYSTPYLGYPFFQDGDGKAPRHGVYRWHIPDPIIFHEDLEVTVQVIGHDGRRLFERTDDVASIAYWYQSEPHVPFPTFPEKRDRRPR
ncbi:glycoside hydrolase family 172 protein [Halomontanus rarus]|uniref:glycoside hydrolase family 172 protein n=1 Tax=Halomontanus rarus TaxID=3034020 RepID=UPI0023E86F2C|nr:glycoside hydrolase family 172 protein [Halovivax sp. TS33]